MYIKQILCIPETNGIIIVDDKETKWGVFQPVIPNSPASTFYI